MVKGPANMKKNISHPGRVCVAITVPWMRTHASTTSRQYGSLWTVVYISDDCSISRPVWEKPRRKPHIGSIGWHQNV